MSSYKELSNVDFSDKNYEEIHEGDEEIFPSESILYTGYTYFINKINELEEQDYILLTNLLKQYFSADVYLFVPFLLEEYKNSTGKFNFLVQIIKILFYFHMNY